MATVAHGAHVVVGMPPFSMADASPLFSSPLSSSSSTLQPSAPLPLSQSVQPKYRRWCPKNKWSRVTLAIVLIHFLLVVSFEIVILALHAVQASYLNHPGMEVGHAFSQIVVVYHAVFIFGLVFGLCLGFDMVLKKNLFEVAAYLILMAGSLAYSAIQYTQHDTLNSMERLHLMDVHRFRLHSDGFEITAIVITTICLITDLLLSYKLYQVFGWDIYKRVGASPENQRMHMWYQIFLALVKLDLFLCLAYSLQLLALLLRTHNSSWWVQIGVGISATLIVFGIGIYAVQKENLLAMMLFLLSVISGIVELITRLISMNDSVSGRKYMGMKAPIGFLTGVGLFLLIVTLLVGFICLSNFKKGLRERILESHHRDKHAGNSKNMNRQSWTIEE